jgi:DNA repair ATPase RecN
MNFSRRWGMNKPTEDEIGEALKWADGLLVDNSPFNWEHGQVEVLAKAYLDMKARAKHWEAQATVSQEDLKEVRAELSELTKLHQGACDEWDREASKLEAQAERLSKLLVLSLKKYHGPLTHDYERQEKICPECLEREAIRREISKAKGGE